ncbi:ankyrin repeat domain-containing protein [Rickettsia bellii]|uniref:Ankyrin repeat family protein n=1 Tax=Rickettsia bellii str. RML An4 TaxID=1359193 RepID=A0A0F3QE94_RICBE|nr:ankyrin repeat domain-containing protein [Rickettsia bellii]KJV89749.1 ankyrin repeat family protein [Rickettsia bellii str. RML An4]
MLIKNNAKFKKNRYELFCQALESGNLTATKYLFKKEFLNNINDKNGQNYLYYIATGGNKEVLEYLVKKNHDNGKKILTQFVDKQRNTPIHIAAQNGQFEIIKNFQKLGFDINARNADGETVLHILARAQNGEMIKELIKLGADINIKNKIGKTALDKVEEDFKGISKKISNKQLQ